MYRALYNMKSDKLECSNSRTVSWGCVVGKMYGRVLIKRIKDEP